MRIKRTSLPCTMLRTAPRRISASYARETAASAAARSLTTSPAPRRSVRRFACASLTNSSSMHARLVWASSSALASVSLGRLCNQSSTVRRTGHQGSSGVIRGHQGSSRVIMGHQGSLRVIRGDHGRSPVEQVEHDVPYGRAEAALIDAEADLPASLAELHDHGPARLDGPMQRPMQRKGGREARH